MSVIKISIILFSLDLINSIRTNLKSRYLLAKYMDIIKFLNTIEYEALRKHFLVKLRFEGSQSIV